MKKYLFILFLISLIYQAKSQTKYFPIPGAIEIRGDKINGTLDDLTDFSTRTQVPFTMPDGTKLMTDIYLPILQDSFVYNDTITFNLLPAPFPPIRIPTPLPKSVTGRHFISSGIDNHFDVSEYILSKKLNFTDVAAHL